ncbi:hypothetical protein HNR44_002134 [Geomicrobium halophilum]|uniref:Uncharacterized protein n=1 Tax=Geomicrobium halophilum TaxID=549000 RepID=A0A841PV22_9BACL|nr:hypothetical protein [Geomicrobium halophilum]
MDALFSAACQKYRSKSSAFQRNREIAEAQYQVGSFVFVKERSFPDEV